MGNSPSEILALTNEAAVLVRGGRVQYANSCACRIFGGDCAGQSVRDLFGREIAGIQARAFVCGIVRDSVQYVLRVSPVDDAQIFFLSPQDVASDYMNDAILFSLRTSLSSFSMAAERAREIAESVGGELVGYLNSMTHSYFRISRNIRNITVVRSASAGTTAKDLRHFDLASLCRSAVEAVVSLRTGENVIFGFEGSLPMVGDPHLVELLLSNLISNAILHACGHSRILVNLLDAGDSVILSVSDDGCGIEPELLPKVFSRYRYGFDLTEIGRGAGFGLGAALAVASLHGGTLLLESRAGSGTSVRASLKKRRPEGLHTVPEQYSVTVEDVLTDFSDCLPDSCFSPKYLE